MRAIAFDLDGTLVDSRHDIVDAIGAALAGIGRPSELGEDAIGRLVGRPLTEMFLAAVPTLDSAELARATDGYRDHYVRNCTRRSRIYPGVEEALDALRGRVRLGCATTKRPAQAHAVLAGFGLIERLDGWLGTAPSMRYKPAPDLLLAMAEALGVAPAEMIYVGDSPVDLLAARAAGCRAAWVRWGYGDEVACLEATPAFVLETPAELPALLDDVPR